MNATALTSPGRECVLTVGVDYGDADVERAADSLNVAISEQEVQAILANVDDELPALAEAAARSAVTARIYDDLRRLARARAWSDDD
jgi:hypothetical protein